MILIDTESSLILTVFFIPGPLYIKDEEKQIKNYPLHEASNFPSSLKASHPNLMEITAKTSPRKAYQKCLVM